LYLASEVSEGKSKVTTKMAPLVVFLFGVISNHIKFSYPMVVVKAVVTSVDLTKAANIVVVGSVAY
jgi:hypothetical protein